MRQVPAQKLKASGQCPVSGRPRDRGLDATRAASEPGCPGFRQHETQCSYEAQHWDATSHVAQEKAVPAVGVWAWGLAASQQPEVGLTAVRGQT